MTTVSTFNRVGIREDLTDLIDMISPTETPFYTKADKSVTVNQSYHEWQTDALASADGSNAVVEGDDAVDNAAAATTRLGNYVQTSDKVVRVSTRVERVDKAGRAKEMAYQEMKRGLELRRDIETILLQNQARSAGSSSTASLVGSVLSWIDTNTSFGATGGDGSAGSTARTDGTQRALQESMILDVLQAAWTAGGAPDVIMVGPYNKRKISTEFTGISTAMREVTSKKVISAVDLYESDFGTLSIIPNRFQRARDALILQMDKWGIGFLEPLGAQDLAVTGLSRRRQLWGTYTLESRNEAASGGVFDLTTTN